MLDGEAIEQIRRIICFFSAHKKNIIFRPVYDHEGRGEEKEPDTFEMIKSHLSAIADLVLEHSDSIYVFQGLLVGNWGEMHGSKYLGKGHLRELTSILDEKLAGKVYLAVRRPVYYRKIRDGYESGEDQCKMGMFDDAIFASETDFGTFGINEATEWEKSWNRDSELTFMETICLNAPNGGETVWGEAYTDKLSSKEIIRALAKMRLSYLNRLYDKKVLDKWNLIPSGASGIWKLSSLYSYVEAHLGYRYVVESISDSRNKDLFELGICVANTGFAPAYKDIELKLITVCNGIERVFSTGQIVSDIAPGAKEKYKIDVRLTNNVGFVTKILVGMSCIENGADVLFGNENVNKYVFLGELTDCMVEGVEK